MSALKQKTQEDFMNTEIDGMPFSEIMNQAVKLKTHQAKPDRWKWDSWPKIKQNTMFQRPEVEAARELPFKERLAAAYAIKAVADAAFKDRNMYEAVYRYEHVIAVFRWLQNCDPGWKKKGINDLDISEHAFEPANQDEAAQVSLLLVACYLNLARAYHKKGGDLPTAMSACDYALAVDQECDKALLLRAQLRLSPASAGATEHDLSIKDTNAAAQVLNQKLRNVDAKISQSQDSTITPTALLEAQDDGTFDMDQAVPVTTTIIGDEVGGDGGSEGGSGSGPSPPTAAAAAAAETLVKTQEGLEAEKVQVTKRTKEVVKYLKKLKNEQQEQKVLDKEWGNVFTKGLLASGSYDDKDEKGEGGGEADGGGVKGGEEDGEEDENADPVPAEVLRQLNDAQRLQQVYEQRGQVEDAERIRIEVETSKEKIDGVRNRHRARVLALKKKKKKEELEEEEEEEVRKEEEEVHRREATTEREEKRYDQERDEKRDGGVFSASSSEECRPFQKKKRSSPAVASGFLKPAAAPTSVFSSSSSTPVMSSSSLSSSALSSSSSSSALSSSRSSTITASASASSYSSLTKASSSTTSSSFPSAAVDRGGGVDDDDCDGPLEGATFANVDFHNPTKEMRKDASERGIDLDDPAVLRMLQQLQQAHETAGSEMTDESIAQAFDTAHEDHLDKIRTDVKPLVESMDSHQIRDALEVLNIPTSHPATVTEAAAAARAAGKSEAEAFAAAAAVVGGGGGGGGSNKNKEKMTKVKRNNSNKSRLGKNFDRSELVEAMVSEVVRRAEHGEPLPDFNSQSSRLSSSRGLLGMFLAKTRAATGFFSSLSPSSSSLPSSPSPPPPPPMSAEQKRKAAEQEVKEQQTRTFRITFVAAVSIFMVRIWCSGHLQVLFAGLWGEVSPSGQGFFSAFDSAMSSRGLKAATRRVLGGGGVRGGGGEGSDDDEDEAFGYFGEEDEAGKGFYDDEF